jgi:hypothetical protein
MLVGVNLLVFDLGEIEEGDFLCALKLGIKRMDLFGTWLLYMGQHRRSSKQIFSLSWSSYVQKKPYLS